MRLLRLRAGTPLRRTAKHFGVQARTFQVLAMTGWEKAFGL
jgi:hypothetical protein